MTLRSARDASSKYLVCADCDAGYQAEELIEAPVDDLLSAQEKMLGKASNLSATARSDAAAHFGSRLFSSFVRGSLAEVFFLSLGAANEREAILRICLRFSSTTPELEELGWEYLYWRIRGEFFGFLPEISIVRSVSTPARPRVAESRSPLRALVVLNSPLDLPAFNLEQHYSLVREGLDPLIEERLLTVTPLRKPTRNALLEAVQVEQYHVVHFVSHGAFDEDLEEGALFFEDSHSRRAGVTGKDLATLLGTCTTLRLVVVGACEGAKGSRSNSSSIAQRLAKAGVPAVVAMREPISRQAMLDMTPIFYRHLAQSGSVDASLMQVRRALAKENSIEWGVPALFSNLRSDLCFEFRGVPGHPCYAELIRLEDLASSAPPGLEYAAEQIYKISLGRWLREPARELRAHHAAITAHRETRTLLHPRDLRQEVDEFISKFWVARCSSH